MIYVTSDLHLCHDREFLYKPRGFENVSDMNEFIVNAWNEKIDVDDTVYVLGDLVLGGDKGTECGIKMLSSLNGDIHVILGNHDTDNRVARYRELLNISSIQYADMLQYNGYRFFMTHYPCYTSNLTKETMKQCVLNLHGHLHSKKKFYEDIPYMYNVCMDAHGCKPVSIDTIIEDIKNKIIECKNEL